MSDDDQIFVFSWSPKQRAAIDELKRTLGLRYDAQVIVLALDNQCLLSGIDVDESVFRPANVRPEHSRR